VLQAPAAHDAHADALQVTFLELVALARHHAVEGKARTDAADARCEVGNAADLAHVRELRLLGKHVPHVRRAEGEERQQGDAWQGTGRCPALGPVVVAEGGPLAAPRTQAHARGLLAARASRGGAATRADASIGGDREAWASEALGRDAGLADALDGMVCKVACAQRPVSNWG